MGRVSDGESGSSEALETILRSGIIFSVRSLWKITVNPMIAFYLKRGERRFQQGFLEILKWIRILSPQIPCKLFHDPSDSIGLDGIEGVETLPISAAPPFGGDELPEDLTRNIERIAPRIILWGPDPVDGSLKSYHSPRPIPFSSRLRYMGKAEAKKELTLTLIHAEPNPKDPTLRPIPLNADDAIFTGFVAVDHMTKNTIWPIHTRGAEVTANLVKNISYGRSLCPDAFLYPIIAMIEPTRRCNLACPMCPVGSNQTYQAKDMPLDRFQKILDELKPFLIHLTLHNYGESFLHRYIYEMISYAKKEGVPDVNISTNGHIIDPSRVVDSGLDEIMISLDGITQKTYATYRRGGRLERVLENIRALDAEKRKKKTQKPLMELQFIIMKHNEGEIDGFRDLASGLGADRIRFKTFNLQMSGPESCETGVEFLPTDTDYTRYEDTQGRILKKHLEENRCKWPWERVVINTDGHVVPCCNDFDGRYSMGNLFSTPFRDIWFGSKYNRFRKSILKEWRKISLCANCPVPSFADLSFERLETTQS